MRRTPLDNAGFICFQSNFFPKPKQKFQRKIEFVQNYQKRNFEEAWDKLKAKNIFFEIIFNKIIFGNFEIKLKINF